MTEAEQLEFILKLQKDPVLFFTQVLGVKLEEYQERILKAVMDNDRTAISACHDVGKSWTLARIVLWYCSVFPGAKIITTAPTFNQVKNILWSEIRSAYANSKFPLGGKMNMTEWQLGESGDWFAIGFTPRNEVTSESGQGKSSSFQGFHSNHIMLIFDEATGVPKPIWDMAEGILTSGNVKFVAIGNPTSRSSEFYKCFSSPDWAKIKLSCFDSPNLKANGIHNLEDLKREVDHVRSLNDVDAQMRLKSYVVVKPYLITLKWVVSMAMPRKWGFDHPLFVSKVLGEFPKDSENALMPLGFVEEAMLRVYFPIEGDRKSLGVDIARFGSDSTVLTAQHGKQWMKRLQLIKRDTPQVTGEVIAMCNDIGPFDVIVVDETGLGGGVLDMLREAQRESKIDRNTEIRGVQFGAACEEDEDKDKYVNVKARMFDLLSKDLKDPSGLCLPPNEDIYLDELPTILYFYDSKGRMRIESKDEYKKRTGRGSPDNSDSLALSNYGMYNEFSVGKFTEDMNKSHRGPMAGGMNSGKRW